MPFTRQKMIMMSEIAQNGISLKMFFR